MIDRLLVDANAVVALIRRDQTEPPLDQAREVLLPLPVVGELFAGAHYSNRVAENLAKVEEIIAAFTIAVSTASPVSWSSTGNREIAAIDSRGHERHRLSSRSSLRIAPFRKHSRAHPPHVHAASG